MIPGAQCACHECKNFPPWPILHLAPLERDVANRLDQGLSPWRNPGRGRSRYESQALGRMHRKGLAGWSPGGPWYLTDAGRLALRGAS